MGTVDDDVLLPRATSLDKCRAVVVVGIVVVALVAFVLDDFVDRLVQHFSCCG